MNEHLKPIFQIVLPALEKAGIDYWVYGGVAIASTKGEFYRPNDDIDIFVFDNDYQRTLKEIEKLNYDWIRIEVAEPLKGRPKNNYFIEIKGEEKEIFSVIPVYKVNNDKVKFIYKIELIPQVLLIREKRAIGDYIFFTPSTEFIKEQFIHKIKGKIIKETELSEKEQKDAGVLFGPDYSRIVERF